MSTITRDWTISRHAAPEWAFQVGVYDTEGHLVATVFSNDEDASLIVAAPALLEACDTVARMLDERERAVGCPLSPEFTDMRRILRDAALLARNGP